jgi:hypothetical protein
VNPTKIENENIYDKPEYEIVACKGTTWLVRTQHNNKLLFLLET